MAETKLLSELKPGDKGRVVKIGGSGPVHRRILDMGVVPGVEINVERVAPLGDPVDFKLLGYHLSLRKEEAQHVHVEVS